MRKCLKIVVGLVVLYSATATAAPATMEEMKATVDALQSKLQAQQGRLDQLENRVAQDMKLEMAKVAKELAADAAKQSATPAWLDNLKFYGDFRLRTSSTAPTTPAKSSVRPATPGGRRTATA